MIEDFQYGTESLNVGGNEDLFKFFKKILGHGPSEKSKRLSKNSFFVDTTVKIYNFIESYCTSQDPKEDLIEYCKSNHYMEPQEKSVQDHQD